MSVQKTKNSAATKDIKSAPKKRSKKGFKARNDKFIPASAKKDLKGIDTTNDQLMVDERLRKPLITQDPEWHKKTPEERKVLRKTSKIKNLRVSSFVRKEGFLKHRITVHLKNDTHDSEFKTTYSDMIEDHKVDEYLNLFFKHQENKVLKIYYNGKRYTWKTV